jgi:outer membrane cobalamin receptor
VKTVIPNIINLSKKAKRCCTDTKTLKKYQLVNLKVKGQIEVTMEHDTPSHDYTPTYQISLIYRKSQKNYDSDTITLQKYQLFDLKVKDKMWSCWYISHPLMIIHLHTKYH